MQATTLHDDRVNRKPAAELTANVTGTGVPFLPATCRTRTIVRNDFAAVASCDMRFSARSGR
jgi:hypothetical protein